MANPLYVKWLIYGLEQLVKSVFFSYRFLHFSYEIVLFKGKRDRISHLCFLFSYNFIIFVFGKENGFWFNKKTGLLHCKGWKKFGIFLSLDLNTKISIWVFMDV